MSEHMGADGADSVPGSNYAFHFGENKFFRAAIPTSVQLVLSLAVLSGVTLGGLGLLRIGAAGLRAAGSGGAPADAAAPGGDEETEQA